MRRLARDAKDALCLPTLDVIAALGFAAKDMRTGLSSNCKQGGKLMHVRGVVEVSTNP